MDVRVLVATNRDLLDEVRKGRFREELWYRLNVVQIHLPPLKERREDIPVLLRFFLNEANRKFSKNVVAVAPDALAVISHYDFPGNVRELRHVVEHAVLMADKQTLRVEDLPVQVVADASRHRLIAQSGTLASSPATSPSTSVTSGGAAPGGVPQLEPTFKTIAEAEKDLIQWTLAKLNGNQTEIAKRLGISRSTLWRKIKQYGVHV